MKFAMKLGVVLLAVTSVPSTIMLAQSGTTAAKTMKKAKKADEDRKRQRFRGALQGIPFGAKDLLAAAGERSKSNV